MEDKFISKRYWKDMSTPMGKVDELAKQYGDVIDLSLGDPNINTPEIIIAETFKDVRNGHTKYTDFRGDPELRKEIKDYYKEAFRMDISDEEIFVTGGACIAMYLVLEAILDDGDEVILQAPFFTPYVQQVELARGVPVELPTYEDEDFQINMNRLEGLITPKTKALIINTPGNPTGSCLKPDTMKQIARIAEKYDLIIIADDIYTAFSFQYPFIPFLSVSNMRERTVTINSFSKDYIMTGWRIGNIIAPEHIIKVVQQINENVLFTAPSISQRAAIHALRNRKAIIPEITQTYKDLVTYAAEHINEIPNISVSFPPKGTFYLFANIKKTGRKSTEVSEIILREAHVLTIPGSTFGECGEGYIRFACTVKKELIKEAADRMKKVSILNKEH